MYANCNSAISSILLSSAQLCFAHILLHLDYLLSYPKAGEVAEGGRRRESEMANSRTVAISGVPDMMASKGLLSAAGTLVSEQ